MSRPEYELTIPVPKSKGVTLTLRTPSEQERAHFKSSNAVCVATAIKELERREVQVYEAIAERRLPDGAVVPLDDADLFDEDGSIREPFGVQNRWFPEWFKQRYDANVNELREPSVRLMRIARWYGALQGPHRAGNRGWQFTWSFDGQSWHEAPGEITGRPLIVHGLSITDMARVELVDLFLRDEMEPLGHELLREAKGHEYGNPRSALILAISAAEAGVKQFVVSVEPRTAWLIESVQSPPLVKLVDEYLPKLLTDNSIEFGARRAAKARQ